MCVSVCVRVYVCVCLTIFLSYFLQMSIFKSGLLCSAPAAAPYQVLDDAGVDKAIFSTLLAVVFKILYLLFLYRLSGILSLKFQAF